MRIVHVSQNLDGSGGLEHYVKRSGELMVIAGHTVSVVHGGKSRGTGQADWKSVAVARDGSVDEQSRMAFMHSVQACDPDLVLSQNLGDGRLLGMLAEAAPTLEVLHSFACAGAKLFRGRDQVCTHPIGRRCLVDWYLGPCGDAPAPSAALSSLSRARGYVDAWRLARGVAVPSTFMADYVVGEGLSPDAVFVFDNSEGISPPARLRPAPRTRLVYSGRLSQAKGVQYLLHALANLPKEFTLMVAGDGWYRPKLEQLRERTGLQDRVSFCGELSDTALAKLLQERDIAVVPSVWPDPAPLVVPEARARGLAVVATDVGGLPEWGARLGGVVIARSADADALSEAIMTASREGVSEAIHAPAPPSLLEVASGIGIKDSTTPRRTP